MGTQLPLAHFGTQRFYIFCDCCRAAKLYRHRVTVMVVVVVVVVVVMMMMMMMMEMVVVV